MKNIIGYISLLLILQAVLSCNKDADVVNPIPISSVTIVNAVIGSGSIVADLTGSTSVIDFHSTAPKVGYGSFRQYSIGSGNIPIVIYNPSDTISPLFKSNLHLNNSSIYSLFLFGTNTKQPDTLLTQDHPLYHNVTDSSIGIRFVNLSPGGNPISLNQVGNVNGSEVSSMGYKAITSFKNYSATSNVTKYVFEIRDAVSGKLLTTTGNLVANDPNDPENGLGPFRNITIAVIGSKEPLATVRIKTMLIKNY